MLLAYILVSIVSTIALLFVLRHPPAPPPKGSSPVIERRIHRPHLPHIRRPRHDN